MDACFAGFAWLVGKPLLCLLRVICLDLLTISVCYGVVVSLMGVWVLSASVNLFWVICVPFCWYFVGWVDLLICNLLVTLCVAWICLVMLYCGSWFGGLLVVY